FFGKGKRAQLFAGHQFRQPSLLLFVRPKKQEGADADGMMRIDEHRGRCAAATDFLQNFAVRHLRKTATAVLRWRSHSQNADTSKTINYFARNIGVPVDRHWIQFRAEKFPEFLQCFIELDLLPRRDPRIRHYPVGNEMTLEQSFDETERLRAGEK